MTPLTRREDLSGLTFAPYRALPRTVRAVQLAQAEEVTHPFAAGGTFHGEPGAWKVTYGPNPDGSPNRAIVDEEVFARTYEHVAGDQFRKRPVTVLATRLAGPLDIVTLEGPSHGNPGDWVVVGAGGDCWFNDDDGFRRRYEPAIGTTA